MRTEYELRIVRDIKSSVGGMLAGVILPLLLTLGMLACAPPVWAAVTIESFTAESASTLAGAHSDASTSFAFKTLFDPTGLGPRAVGGDPQQAVVNLPPGLVANPNNVPKCARALFSAIALQFEAPGGCPADTQVGYAILGLVAPGGAGYVPVRLGIYNIAPEPGEPALLGLEGNFSPFTAVVPIHIALSASNHYAVTAEVADLTYDPGYTLSSSVTLWAVPAAHARVDGSSACDYEPVSGSCTTDGGRSSLQEPIPPAPVSGWKPFMENPTGCVETPVTTLAVNTLEEPDTFSTTTATSPNATECASVPFAPSISLTPDTSQAGAPTGLSVDLTTPQSNDPNGQGTAELDKAVITLPAGMAVSPSAGSRVLEACTDEQLAAGSDVPARCPRASVIGEDEVESPVLPRTSTGGEGKLNGKVYLGQPLSTDPTSGQMFRIFQELRGFGLDVKLEGSVVANPQTGQLTATFSNLPELPFQNFKMHFDGGPNAVLVNPRTCGSNVTRTTLYPYSSPSTPTTPSSSFDTGYVGAGAPCPASLPFSPVSSISTASQQAGALSALTVSFSRSDGEQPLGRIGATLPEGLLGYVSKVQLCEATQAIAGTCSAESRVGTVSTTAGAGSDPLTVRGSVYLARGSDGYPFMLSVVVPAVAGPYNLGNVVVPVWLQVNSDGSITTVSGPLPSILDGIPLDIRSVTLTMDRPGFTVNPTGCGPLSLSGTAVSLSGTPAPLSAPFQVSGCGSLPFAPSFAAATQGATSKANGASVAVRIAPRAGEADIRSVHVELPKQLPSRLATLQKSCTEAQFNSNPADCPVASDVGTAVAYTPLLSTRLTGPAILISHGGAAFPDLEIVLQGEGVTVILDGQTAIKKGVTSSTFASVPDVPISGFELTLPEGPYSLLTTNVTLCAGKLLMPTIITGQNGMVVNQATRIAVSGCPEVTVSRTKATAGRLLVTVHTNAKGVVQISGKGLQTMTKRNIKAGTSRIVVSLTRSGRALRERHGTLMLHASLTVGKVAVAKTTTVKL